MNSLIIISITLFVIFPLSICKAYIVCSAVAPSFLWYLTSKFRSKNRFPGLGLSERIQPSTRRISIKINSSIRRYFEQLVLHLNITPWSKKPAELNVNVHSPVSEATGSSILVVIFFLYFFFILPAFGSSDNLYTELFLNKENWIWSHIYIFIQKYVFHWSHCCQTGILGVLE